MRIHTEEELLDCLVNKNKLLKELETSMFSDILSNELEARLIRSGDLEENNIVTETSINNILRMNQAEAIEIVDNLSTSIIPHIIYNYDGTYSVVGHIEYEMCDLCK
jgi:hypothetical protein